MVFDVAIIGAGPSGASTALKLAKAGISTVIIEKEKLPRYKVCGGGFVYRGLNSMSFDVEAVIESKFHTVDIYLGEKLHFKTTRKDPIISMIMRDSFDELIIKEAKKHGATLMDEHKVVSIEKKGLSTLITTNKNTVSAKIIVGADGAYSPIAKMAGWKTDTRKLIPALEYEVYVTDEEFKKHADSVRFDIDAVPGGYGWNFPKKNHFSIGVGCFEAKPSNIKALCEDYINYLGIENITSIERHGFQIPVSPRTDGFAKDNVFLIGDAAGFADSITAEGISNAIYSGNLLAEAIIENSLNQELIAAEYLKKLNHKLLPELESSAKLSKWFYKNKTIRNLLLRKYGQRFSEYMGDIFMGTKTYPTDVYDTLMKKVKKAVL